MCICDVERGKEKHVKDGDYNVMYIERDRRGNYYLKAEGDGCVYLYLHYCPECGRRLDGEDF